MLLRWFPWKPLVSRVARARGLIDPIRVLSRLESFGQPLEVKEPLELLRAGVVFHARGLLNTSAIQHNLDWIWPYWVDRQYDPLDSSFIPRAFSVTHINLTHRNWTAIGVPDGEELPIVDPAGLVTPFWDGWSIDAWIATDQDWLIPSRLRNPKQVALTDEGFRVVTTSAAGDLALISIASVEREGGRCLCRIEMGGRADRDARLVVSVRPYNPEGVSFIQRIEIAEDGRSWRVDRSRTIEFEKRPSFHALSDYRSGDVHRRLEPRDESEVSCRTGMATAAAVFPIHKGRPAQITVDIPLGTTVVENHASHTWASSLAGTASLEWPVGRFAALYETALRSVILHSPGEDVFPGPYTYRRFWFRDAAFILHAMLCAGLIQRAERVIDSFPRRQTARGFFKSQEGEWDSNGEAIWIIHRLEELSGRPTRREVRRAVARGARWIRRKRIDLPGSPHDGLLPAGFSAEHLGPNDFYYWDDFWSVAGLRCAAALAERPDQAHALREEAADLLDSIESSLALAATRLGRLAMPPSPYRRLDSGSIGSLAAGYPLQIFGPDDPRLCDTTEYLLNACLVHGGFHQDIIHSGINPYLTLHIAQVLLRAGDPRARALMEAVESLASPTGQWPEAVHPATGGGCMGDGHHVWAAAEWILAVRHCFVREEGDELVLASGMFDEWLARGRTARFGPAPTRFGAVTVAVTRDEDGITVCWEGAWHRAPKAIEVRIPGREPVRAHPSPGASVTVPCAAEVPA